MVSAESLERPHGPAVENIRNGVPDEHLDGLHQEFDFANPAGPQLHIPMLMPPPGDFFINHFLD